jgi:hypothetical protein
MASQLTLPLVFQFSPDHEAKEIAAANKKENPTEWRMQICP